MSFFWSPALSSTFMINVADHYEKQFALCKQINLKSGDVTLMIQSLS